jgi:hypothetical protein
MLARMARGGLKSRLRPYRVDRFGAAGGGIRAGGGAREAEVFASLPKFLGVLPLVRRRFLGAQEAVLRILDAHAPGGRAQRGGAINVPRRRRGERP